MEASAAGAVRLADRAPGAGGGPNVPFEQAAFNTVIENDLRLALNDGLDELVLDHIATAGFQAPGADPLREHPQRR